MAEYLIQDTTLTAIADAVRAKTGKTGGLSPNEIADDLNNIPIKEEAIIVPTITDLTIEAGQYLGGTQTIVGDANLISSNIKKGVSIFGISGGYDTTSEYYLPILNEGYPSDASVVLKNSVTCKVEIAIEGHPNLYTYQWYKDGSVIPGETNSSCKFTPSAVGTTKLYCIVTSAAGSVTSRIATITVTPLYLYNNGDQCTAVTGGWTVGSDSTGSLYVKDTKNGEVIPYTNSKVPSSKYSKLCVEYKYTSKESSGESSVRLRLVSKLGSSPTVYTYVSFDKSELNVVKTSSVDISSVTVDAYLKFSAYYAKSNVYRIWME